MEANESKPINEEFIEQLIEEIRMSYAHMLKVYLQLCKEQDQFEANVKRENIKHFYRTGQPYHDENGKVNWNIIHQFMPPDMEKRLKEKYNTLNEHEIRLCCLLFFKVSNKTIANILPYRKESIYPTTGRIRQKTGLKGLNEMFQFMALYHKDKKN